jgi:hypothetical protein
MTTASYSTRSLTPRKVQKSRPLYRVMKSSPTLQTMTPLAGGKQTNRGILVGKTRYGKSTLLMFLIQTFVKRYSLRGRVLVIDTKPRWRGTQVATGQSPRRRYRDFVEGDTLPGVILDNLRDWNIAWDRKLNPHGIVIAQRFDLDEDDPTLIRWMLGVIRKFKSTQRAGIPSLLVIDEGMDFFGPTGNALYSNTIQKCWRAGGEMGMSCLLGVQRPKTINLQMLTESDLLYLFHIDYAQDLQRLQEMGFPAGVSSPAKKYEFLFMNDEGLWPRPLKLKVSSASATPNTGESE